METATATRQQTARRNVVRLRRHSFAGFYLTKHPSRKPVIRIFASMLGHVPDWTDITDDNLYDLRRELVRSYARNSVRTLLSEIKAVINENIDSHGGEIQSRRYGKILSISGEPSQSIYLSLEEIAKIDAYKPASEHERYVKRIFMIEALTGARNCDSRRLSLDNVDAESDTLTYISQKTRKEVSVPVHKEVIPYLEENKGGIDEFPDLSIWSFNKTLRNICRKCGIGGGVSLYVHGEHASGARWKFVSSHTGRRSFATNLFLAGADPYVIADFMGHSSPRITLEHYIIAKRKPERQVLEFFKKL